MTTKPGTSIGRFAGGLIVGLFGAISMAAIACTIGALFGLGLSVAFRVFMWAAGL